MNRYFNSSVLQILHCFSDLFVLAVLTTCVDPLTESSLQVKHALDPNDDKLLSRADTPPEMESTCTCSTGNVCTFCHC